MKYTNNFYFQRDGLAKSYKQNKMINVFSFQKIITHDSSQTKNISKTLHHVLNQHHKRMLNQSKASLDFRKIVSKHHQAKRNFSKERQEDRKVFTNPLEETSPSIANIQTLLYNKAFKIRSYSKRISREKESENELSTIMMLKSKTKIQLEKLPIISDMPRLKEPQKQNILRMQNYSFPDSIRQIVLSLKIHYKKELKSSLQEIPDQSSLKDISSTKESKNLIKKSSIVINASELAMVLRIQGSKSGQKQKTIQFLLRRVIITLKKTVQAKFNYQKQTSSVQDLPQIIFKVSNSEQYNLMKTILKQCDFSFFHCIFYVQSKHVQSTSIYDLGQINQLKSNIIVLDSLQNFKYHPPFLSEKYSVAFCAILEKANLVTTFQKTLSSSLVLSSVSNQFENFIFTDKKYGQIIQFPLNKFIEKTKQKKAFSLQFQRQITTKNQSQQLNENEQTQSEQKAVNQQNCLGKFKEKMLMYLKIVQKDSNQQIKKSKQSCSSGNEEFQCILGRQQNSKTNIQIVSQLIKLNSSIQKQIVQFQKETQNFLILPYQSESDKFKQKFFNKMFVNILY